MDYEHGRIVAKTHSVLGVQEDELLNKILSRNSSVGFSSRIYYHGRTEGVPFKWEMQPGTPKNRPKEEPIIPLSPPPAVLSLGLPKPCIVVQEPSRIMKLRFWKRSNKKNEYGHRSDRIDHDVHGSDKSDGFSWDGDGSPRNSTSSSASSSFSFRKDPRVQSSRFHTSVNNKELSHGPFSCTPWNFRGIIVSVARRG